MKATIISFFVLLLLLFLIRSRTYCQCLTAPTATCTNTEPLAFDGEVLNTAATKWYYGATATFNSLTLNGGTLIVAGDLTVNQFYMDSGKIFIQPGARFVIGNGIGYGLALKGNSTLYNYGTLEILRNLSFDNGWATPAKPNVLINATAASILKMNNQYFVINNASSWFVNKGKAYFHGLVTDPQSSVHSVCLGKASETKMTVLYNKVKYSFYAPEAYACVAVSEYSQVWDTLAENPYINLCLGMTHRLDSSCMIYGCKPSWGMANLFRGCLGCNAIQVLTTRFISFSVQQAAGGNKLNWEMENYLATGSFEIEASVGGQQFNTIHTLTGDKQGNTKTYSYVDETVLPGWNYYRVKYSTSATSLITYTPVIKIYNKPPVSMVVYPNPFTDNLFLSLPGSFPSVYVTLINMYGAKVANRQLIQPGDKWELKLPPLLPAGIYILTVKAGETTWHQKLIKR